MPTGFWILDSDSWLLNLKFAIRNSKFAMIHYALFLLDSDPGSLLYAPCAMRYAIPPLSCNVLETRRYNARRREWDIAHPLYASPANRL